MRCHEESTPALYTPSAALTTFLIANLFHKKLARNVPNSIPRKNLFLLQFHYNCLNNVFYWYVGISRDLTVFMMSFISLFDITIIISLDLKIFSWISVSAADTATVNPSSTDILLASGQNTFFSNGRPTFIKGPRILPMILPDCVTLDSRVFDNFISLDKLFAESVRRSSTCALDKIHYVENQFH